MLTKFVLVVIVMSADGMNYADFVDKPADTLQECEEKKYLVLKSLKRQFDKSHFFFASCVAPKGLHSVEV